MTRARLLALALAPLSLQAEETLPLGIEVVTGYRSEYLYRGQRLAQDTLEAQIEGEIALSNEWILNLGGWRAEATGSDGFSETSAYADLRFEQDRWTLSLQTTLHQYQDSFLDDGVSLTPSFTWHLNDDWSFELGSSYHTGTEGFYSHAEFQWSRPLSESSFLSAKLGSGLAHDDQALGSGWNDVYARLAWTYTINPSVSFTPFIGTSIAPSSSNADDSLYAGIWFEVNF